MTDPVPVDSYACYRARLLAASIPATAAAVFAATLVFEALSGLASPERLRVEWLPDAIQLLVPVATWLLSRGGWRERPQALLLGADCAYTTSLIARLALPTTSLSGTSLYVAVKMLTTALLVPWGASRQSVSVGFTMIVLSTALLLTHVDLHGAQASHLWLGPLVAGFLSIAGATTGDRVRRAVFERERELRASAEHLRQEVEVDEALARVGQELIALPDTHRILDALCRLTTEVLGADASHTYLWDAERQEYAPTAGYGDTPEQWEALRVVHYPQQLMGRLQERISVTGVEQFLLDDRPLPSTALLRQFDTSVVLCLALRRGDKLIGVQSAERRGPRRPFSPHQVRIARGMAHLASLALETARLVEELGTANRLKSEFVATMSHELRSPLNIIIGYHELLLDGGFGTLSEVQRDPLRRADRSARELLELVNATLDLSRLEARRIPLDLDQLAVAELVEEVGREFATVARDTAVTVDWQVTPTLPPLRTDRVKLKMVLKNLVGNAVKFTERGRVLLEAAAVGDGVEFRVSDTGVGIPAEALAVIFEPFRQLDAARGGAGLGLYIVTQLLTALDGTIVVESVVGTGSTFRVRLPWRGPVESRGTAGDGHERPGEGGEPETAR
jgi:signal transduction histidine kinase